MRYSPIISLILLARLIQGHLIHYAIKRKLRNLCMQFINIVFSLGYGQQNNVYSNVDPTTTKSQNNADPITAYAGAIAPIVSQAFNDLPTKVSSIFKVYGNNDPITAAATSTVESLPMEANTTEDPCYNGEEEANSTSTVSEVYSNEDSVIQTPSINAESASTDVYGNDDPAVAADAYSDPTEAPANDTTEPDTGFNDPVDAYTQSDDPEITSDSPVDNNTDPEAADTYGNVEAATETSNYNNPVDAIKSNPIVADLVNNLPSVLNDLPSAQVSPEEELSSVSCSTANANNSLETSAVDPTLNTASNKLPNYEFSSASNAAFQMLFLAVVNTV